MSDEKFLYVAEAESLRDTKWYNCLEDICNEFVFMSHRQLAVAKNLGGSDFVFIKEPKCSFPPDPSFRQVGTQDEREDSGVTFLSSFWI